MLDFVKETTNEGLHRGMSGSDRVLDDLRLTQFSIDCASDGIFRVSMKGRFTYVNQAACSSLGYSRDELLSMSVHDLSQSVPAETWPRQLKKLKERGPYSGEVECRTKDGRIIPIEITVHHVKFGGKEQLCGFGRDISRRKHLEQQLLHSQKMDVVGQLAGGIAHDFNNLLSAILGYSQLGMMKLSAGDQVSGYLQEIQKAAERASDLTRQLLAFSRRQTIEARVLSLNELVLNTDRMLRRLIGEDVELVTLPARDLGLARVDPGQMEQVLINLAVNARDAMPYGGKLIIGTGNLTLSGAQTKPHPELATGNYVFLSVRDTGSGMDEDVKAHIFEPFFTTKDVGQGSGLGLSTCYGIVAQSGGHITIDSEPGRGTTVKIYLPRVDEVAPLLPLRDEYGYLPVGTETVLLVEDEPALRAVASHVLREQGYSVLEAANGVEALSIAREHAGTNIALLLTDVVMPLMGGTELAERLSEIHTETRIL